MNSSKIKNLLAKRCGKTFLGVFAADRLPSRLPARRPLLLVCNTAPHNNSGEHWIALFIDVKGQYFDSFGSPPQKIFRLYLEKFFNSFTFNDKMLQSIISYHCGHFVIFYCLMKMLDYSVKEIGDAFSSDTALNCFIVDRFVCDFL